MQPSVGRIVIYRLTADDAQQINRRRTTGQAIAGRIQQETWPLGAQAHIGSEVTEGQEFPMLVVLVKADPDKDDPSGWQTDANRAVTVNGQVALDGTDVLWRIMLREGPANGQWHWPVKV